MVTKIEVVYYAKCSQTGEVFVSDDFKSLYHHVRYHFRLDIHYSHYYDCRGAVLRYGILIHGDDESVQFKSFRDYGYLFVGGIDGEISRCEFERW